jgi:octaprenyl-diphosphate synthase
MALLRRHKAIEATLERARYYGSMAQDALAIFRDSQAKRALLGAVAFCVNRAY